MAETEQYEEAKTKVLALSELAQRLMSEGGEFVRFGKLAQLRAEIILRLEMRNRDRLQLQHTMIGMTGAHADDTKRKRIEADG